MNRMVIVCGGRDYDDYESVKKALDGIYNFNLGNIILVQGGAKGVDSLAKAWAINKGVQTMTFEANWNKYGPSAGPRRNREMALAGKEHGNAVLVAFPGGRGTDNMKKTCKGLGIPIITIDK